MIESIVRSALRFKALLAALAVGLLVLGALSLRQMPSDVTPELAQAPVLDVQTEALGLSAPHRRGVPYRQAPGAPFPASGRLLPL